MVFTRMVKERMDMYIQKNSYSISNFICQECGNSFPLPRQNNRKRNKKHIKDLWCPHCKKVVKTIELREDDFFITMDQRKIYV